MEGAAAAGLYKRKKTFTYKKLRKQDVIAHWRIYRGDKVKEFSKSTITSPFLKTKYHSLII